MTSNLNQALEILKKYSCVEPKTPDSDAEKQQLSQAVKLIANQADSINIGICAANLREGFDALNSYLKGLEYPVTFEMSATQSKIDPVYIKFNGEKMSHVVSEYSGGYRGVLITVFAYTNEQIMGTYGHLPLNLFSSD